MSHLQSGGITVAQRDSAKDNCPILDGNANFQSWSNSLQKLSETRYGQVGRNLFSDQPIQLDHPHPGEKEPSERDQRTNAITGELIPDSQKYAREITQDTSIEMSWVFPLKETSAARLNQDIASYKLDLKNHRAEIKALRAEDDILLAFIEDHMKDTLFAMIETHEEWDKHKILPSTYYLRSKSLLRMTTDVFSKGNVRLVVNNLLKTCIDPQGDTSYPEWQSNHNKNWGPAIKSIESQEHPGFIRTDCLEFAFMTHNLNQNPANITAQNNYYLKYQHVMNPRLLTSELVAQNVSLADPRSDPISQQGSALVASPPSALAASASTWGKKDPTRSDHCTNCVSLTKGKERTVNGVAHKGPFYFYGHSKDNCNRQQKLDAAKATKKALLAGTSGPTAPATSNNDPASIQNAYNAHDAQLYHQNAVADAISVMSNATTQQP